MTENGKANRLVKEKSPYLLQHAYNPVDWYPWGEEAFEKARKEDKPIFLSVGYSTCHWCHVMERESFENPAIAALMNDWFVSIKVDREERPDIDRVYMNAAYALTGSGGWPLTVFLTPDLKPFFAGTYFPPEDRYQRPGMPKLLAGIHDAWVNKRGQITQSADQLTTRIRQSMQITPDTTAVEVAGLMKTAYRQLESRYDSEFGGFGRAPKFPQPSNLLFFLRQWSSEGAKGTPDAVLQTLQHMGRGGMYDHLGGGFHRYSTDREWKIPHFEKMLYDQAQLVQAYLEGYQITGEEFYADMARGILDYVARDLRHQGGGFFSAEDADSPVPGSEPEEGAFYAWTIAEVDEILGEERATAFKKHYHFSEEGNFENGKNVLHAPAPLLQTAVSVAMSEEDLAKQLAEDRAKLLAVRVTRPRPHLDDKVLTAWNGLMISAYARAHQVLGDAVYLARSRAAADFILEHSYNARDGTLHRRFRDGESGISGELTDYAFFVQGLLDLYEAGFDIAYLERALQLTDRQIELFWDEPGGGGFFDTAEGESENVFVRTKESNDGAEPTGNSVATLNLARLAQMIGREDLGKRARQSLKLFAGNAKDSPLALTQMWVAADFMNGKPKQVVIAGQPDSEDTRELLRVVNRRFLPRKIILLADGGKGQEWLGKQLPFILAVRPTQGRATAYVCEDFVCQLPTTEPSVVERQLAVPRSMTTSN